MFTIVDPQHYKLDFMQSFNMWELLERVETGTLADMKIYKQHPDWFVRDHFRNTVDYDEKLGPRMILEARRKIEENESPEDYIADHLEQLQPNPKRYSKARELMKGYFTDATRLMELRTPNEKLIVPPDELAYYIGELPSKVAGLHEYKDVVPGICLRNCDQFTEAAIAPSTPMTDRWQDYVDASSKRSLTIGASL